MTFRGPLLYEAVVKVPLGRRDLSPMTVTPSLKEIVKQSGLSHSWIVTL